MYQWRVRTCCVLSTAAVQCACECYSGMRMDKITVLCHTQEILQYYVRRIAISCMITCVKLLYHHEYILKLLMREKEKVTKARGEWNVRPDVLQSQIENCTLFIFSDRAGRVLKCIQWDD